MPRQARLDTPGVLQHVMARGIERRKIFMDDQDRASFLERLALILEDTQTQCYAWTLIPNHFHILLRTGPPASPERERWRAGPTPLSTVMRRREKGDQRILGSGDFVADVIKNANVTLDQTAKFDIPLDELISRVCAKRKIKIKDLISKNKRRYLSQARTEVCYLAVDKLDYRGDDVARILRISGRGVSDCRQRGRKILGNTKMIYDYLT